MIQDSTNPIDDSIKVGKQLLAAIGEERARLSQNQHVPIDELKELVFTTYACSKISEGKACQLLCIDRLEFRKQRDEWFKLNPKILEIFDNREY